MVHWDEITFFGQIIIFLGQIGVENKGFKKILLKMVPSKILTL